MISESSQYEDLQTIVFGGMLGLGIHRKVAAFKAASSRVVIKCAIECPGINWLEWEVWQSIQHCEELAKWFAPCIEISTNGMFLTQRRVYTKPRSEYPKKIPSFFGDLKYTNYGWMDGRFVCCDYAGFISTSMAHKWNGRMKKADWWE